VDRNLTYRLYAEGWNFSPNRAGSTRVIVKPFANAALAARRNLDFRSIVSQP
jgi:hypothetical protein